MASAHVCERLEAVAVALPLRRDPALDAALAVARRRHRQFQGSGFSLLGDCALRDARRAESAMAADQANYLAAAAEAALVRARPSLDQWFEAHDVVASTWPQDGRLLWDLSHAGHHTGDWPSAADIQVNVVMASAAFRDVVEATKAPTPGVNGRREKKVSRKVKRRLRRAARADFEAAVAGLSLVRLAELNQDSTSLIAVAAGSLKRF